MSKAAAVPAEVSNNLVASTDSKTLPAHLQAVEGVGRGNENVGGAMEPPRLLLVQQMSKCIDPHHGNYIKGSEVGDFVNSITKKIYGDAVYALSLSFRTVYQVKRDFNEGGGYKGKFVLESEANEVRNNQPAHEKWDVKETHEHLLVVKDPKTGELETTPVVMEFESSKLPKSRAWNTTIGMKGGDRFACLWKLQAIHQTNKAGATFQNLDCSYVGWAHETDYLAAEQMYELFGPAPAPAPVVLTPAIQ